MNASNVNALQDNSDLETTLHCRLDTNSAEIYSSSMSTGTYTFFDEPELDDGEFSHDLTQIEVSNIQTPTYEVLDTENWEFLNGVNTTQGNHTVGLSDPILEYEVTGGLDTRIEMNFTYLATNFTFTEAFNDEFDVDDWTLYDESWVEQDMQEDGTYFKANYDFVDDPTGTTPDGLTDKSASGNTNHVVDSVGNHKRVINQKVASDKNDHARIDLELASGMTNDLEFYYYPCTDMYSFLSISSGANLLFQIKFEAQASKTLKVLDGAGWRGGWVYTAKWYHFKIKFNFGSEQYDLYVDSVLKIDNGNFYESGSDWDGIAFHLTDAYTSYPSEGNAYIDAIGIMGLDGYSEGDNLGSTDKLVIDQSGNECLNLKSGIYASEVRVEKNDNMTIDLITTSDNEFKLKFMNDGAIVGEEVILPSGNTNYEVQELVTQISTALDFDQLLVYGILDDADYIKFNNLSIHAYSNDNIFENVYFDNFTYQVLGVNYTQTYNLVLDLEKTDSYQENGTYFYYLDSTQFVNYDHVSPLIILNQNITIITEFAFTLELDLYSNITISYSANDWKLPSEANLVINNEDVIDTSLSSGVVYLGAFPEELEITSDIEVNFELNMTISFTLSFDLNVISKTYLKKVFKLLSDHSIYIESIDLPDALNIKKIYLNSVDLGDDDPNNIIPDKEMNTNNIFSLEIILTEELYIPLPYVGDLEDDTLGTIYSEEFLYESGDMTHSNTPDGYNDTYTFDENLEMENQFPNEFQEEDWQDWSSNNDSLYTETCNSCGDFSSELNTYNDSVVPQQPNDFTFTNGSFNDTNYADLNSIDGDHTILNSTNLSPSGTYSGEYTFTDDADGSDPAGWVISEGAGNCEVIAEKGSHTKVVDLTNIDYIEVTTLSDEQDEVEYWIRVTDKNDYVDINGFDDGSELIKLGILSGQLRYRASGGVWTNFKAMNNDQWYHVRFDLKWASGVYDIYVDKIKEVSDVTFKNPKTDGIDKLRIGTSDDSHLYFDAFDLSYSDGYSLYRSYDPLSSDPAMLNFTIETQLDTSIVHSNDTIDFIELEYSYNTSVLGQQFNVSIWNFSSSDWFLIENNTCYNEFSSLNLTIISDFHNSTYHVLLKFEAINSSNEFQLNLEMLRIDYNWTKTAGNIYSSFSKEIYFDFLDRYENYTAYQNLLNITLEFRYSFSNYTGYDYSANFTIETNNYNLSVDGSLNDLEFSFTFNSILRTNFTILFNITNGLLEISEMNYTMTFNCLDSQNRTVLYQYLAIEPTFSLDNYEKTECEIFLTFDYDFSAGVGEHDYFNSIDNHLFSFIINVSSEDSVISLEYGYDLSKSKSFELNLREVITNNSKDEFRDVSIEIYLSGDQSSLEFDTLAIKRKYEAIQVDKSPRTDVDSVEFLDYLVASRDFSYWYFDNSYDINSVDLTNLRNSESITEFETEINSSRYYFHESVQEDDVFSSNLDYDPNWDVSVEVVENTGIYSKLKITYKADMVIRNVTIVLDASDYFNDEWTLNATQSSQTYKLEIPWVDFSSVSKVLYIEGYSDTPLATIREFESDQNWNQLTIDTEIDFVAYLSYPKFTRSFLLNVNSTWTCYDIYYGNNTYTPEKISSTRLYTSGTGFDSAVNNSYLYFTAEPFTTVDWNYENDVITITIESELDVDNVFFKAPFDPSGVHDLELISATNDFNAYNISDTELDGRLTFHSFKVNSGITIIKINVNFATPLEVFLQSILIIVVIVSFIGIYYYFKNNEKKLKAIQQFIDKKVISKLENIKNEDKGLENVTIEVKDGKFYMDTKKK